MFPCPAGCVFSFGRKSSSSNRSSRKVLCLIVQPVVKKLVSEGTLGSFWARFWRVPSFRATVFPCPAGCGVLSFGRKSSSSNRSSRRVLCFIVQTIVQKLVENYCFSRASEGTLGSFWARFWRRSGLCVSLSGRVRFELREEEQQQQQEQQEGSMSHMSHCTTSGIKTGRKLLFF